MKTIIAAVNVAARHEGTWYWTGTGLSAEYDRAERFANRESAFCSWNEHASAFPGWEAMFVAAR